MIRVNLLPTKRKKKAKAVPAFLISMTLLTLAAGIISAYLFYWLNSELSLLTQKKTDNEAQLAELNNKIKEVKNFEEQKKTLEQKTGIIEQLKKNQNFPVKILTEMRNVVPDRVWITAMSISGGNINISGVGFTNEDAVNYADNLEKSQMLTGVSLHATQKSVAGSIVTYQFTITCKVK
ncbi:MAG: hypothetical protein EPN94_03335 [Nitrospirae bacterium]|nr:MAG: hypothetical protein EPN94_03335 [Nitrospirota bacterium]